MRSEAEDPAAPRMLDWQEYGDRLLLGAIGARNAGNKTRERELTVMADKMWNGLGLRDKVYRVDGRYESYKTALYCYLTGNPDARKLLLSLQKRDEQSNRYGGIYTEYGEDGRPFSSTDTNIETSAIARRALGRRQESSSRGTSTSTRRTTSYSLTRISSFPMLH